MSDPMAILQGNVDQAADPLELLQQNIANQPTPEGRGERSMDQLKLNIMSQGGRAPMPELGFRDAMRETFQEGKWVEKLPFFGGAASAYKYKTLWDASKRMEDGVQTREDEKLLVAFLEESQREQGIGYMVGSILTDMPGFVTEFAVSGGIWNAGKKVALKAMGAAVREGVEKAAGKMTWKVAQRKLKEGAYGQAAGVVAKRGVKAMADTVGRLGAMTALGELAGGSRVQAGAWRRALPEMQLTEHDSGRLNLVMQSTAGEFVDQLPKAILDEYIELLSEASGGALVGAVSRVPGAGYVSAMQAQVAEWWVKKNPGQLGKLLDQVAKKGGWHGPLGEFLEERFGGALRGATGVEEGGIIENTFPGLDQMAAEIIAFGAVGGAGGAARQFTGVPEGESLAEGFDQADQPLQPLSEQDLRRHLDKFQREIGEGVEPVQADQLTHRQQEAQRLAEERGIHVAYVTGLEGKPFTVADAGLVREGVIVMDANAKADPLELLAHEVAHNLHRTNPEVAAKLASMAEKLDPEGFATFQENYAKRYEKAMGRPLPGALSAEEGVANYAQERSRLLWFSSTENGRKALEMIVRNDRSAAQKLVDWLKTGLNQLGGRFKLTNEKRIEALESVFQEENLDQGAIQAALLLQEAIDTQLGIVSPAGREDARNRLQGRQDVPRLTEGDGTIRLGPIHPRRPGEPETPEVMEMPGVGDAKQLEGPSFIPLPPSSLEPRDVEAETVSPEEAKLRETIDEQDQDIEGEGIAPGAAGAMHQPEAAPARGPARPPSESIDDWPSDGQTWEWETEYGTYRIYHDRESGQMLVDTPEYEGDKGEHNPIPAQNPVDVAEAAQELAEFAAEDYLDIREEAETDKAEDELQRLKEELRQVPPDNTMEWPSYTGERESDEYITSHPGIGGDYVIQQDEEKRTVNLTMPTGEVSWVRYGQDDYEAFEARHAMAKKAHDHYLEQRPELKGLAEQLEAKQKEVDAEVARRTDQIKARREQEEKDLRASLGFPEGSDQSTHGWVRAAIITYQGDKDRWVGLHNDGATDAEIETMLERMGDMGGGTTEWGHVWHKGGKRPNISLNGRGKKAEVSLSGKKLIQAARDAWRIPYPEGQEPAPKKKAKKKKATKKKPTTKEEKRKDRLEKTKKKAAKAGKPKGPTRYPSGALGQPKTVADFVKDLGGLDLRETSDQGRAKDIEDRLEGKKKGLFAGVLYTRRSKSKHRGTSLDYILEGLAQAGFRTEHDNELRVDYDQFVDWLEEEMMQGNATVHPDFVQEQVAREMEREAEEREAQQLAMAEEYMHSVEAEELAQEQIAETVAAVQEDAPDEGAMLREANTKGEIYLSNLTSRVLASAMTREANKDMPDTVRKLIEASIELKELTPSKRKKLSKKAMVAMLEQIGFTSKFIKTRTKDSLHVKDLVSSLIPAGEVLYQADVSLKSTAFEVQGDEAETDTLRRMANGYAQLLAQTGLDEETWIRAQMSKYESAEQRPHSISGKEVHGVPLEEPAEFKKKDTGQTLIGGGTEQEEIHGTRPGEGIPREKANQIGLFDEEGGLFEDQARERDQGGLPFSVPAWHGGAARHEKFRTSFIGSGEGHTAYGWGLYFTDLEGIAKHYRDQEVRKRRTPGGGNRFDGEVIDGVILNRLMTRGSPAEKELAMAIRNGRLIYRDVRDNYPEVVRKMIENLTKQRDLFSEQAKKLAARRAAGEEDPRMHKDGLTEKESRDASTNRQWRISRLNEALPRLTWSKPGPAPKGGVFKVELAPEDHEWLLWDEPFDKQSDHVKAAIQAWVDGEDEHEADVRARTGWTDKNVEGRQIYWGLTSILGGKEEASMFLLEHGIRGNKYKARVARGTEREVFNYVIFDEADVEILDVFSVPKPQAEPVFMGFDTGPESNTDRWRRWLQDSDIRIRRFEEAMLRHGAAISLKESVYGAIERYTGKLEENQNRFDELHYNPIVKAMAAAGVVLKELDLYLQVRHAKERNEYVAAKHLRQWEKDELVRIRGKARTKAERAQASIDKHEEFLRRGGRTDSLRGLTKKEVAYRKKLLAAAYEKREDGLRVAKNPEMELGPPPADLKFQDHIKKKGGSGWTTPEAARIKGKLEASDRGAALMELGEMVDAMNRFTRDWQRAAGLISAETHATWAKQYRHYVPLRTAFEDSISPTGKRFDIRRKEAHEVEGRHTLAHSPLNFSFEQARRAITRARKNEVGNKFLMLIEKYPDLMKAAGFEIRADQAEAHDELLGEQLPKAPLPAEGEFSTKVQGVETYIKIRDPLILKALQNLGVHQVGPFLAILSKTTRFIGSMATSFNPEFMLTNFVRDLQTAGINLSGEEGTRFALDVTLSALSGQPLRAAYAGIRGKERGSRWSKHYREMERAGGLTGWWTMDNFEKAERRLEVALKDAAPSFARRPLVAAKAVRKWVEDANRAVENNVRLAAYGHARERGQTIEQAATLAKNLTVNFNRRGEAGNAINAAYLFFNASLQGTFRMAKALRHPATWRNLTALAAGEYAIEILNQAMSPDDEDGIPLYDKIPQYKKDRNLIFMLPSGAAITIPLPYGYNIFHAASRKTAELATGKTTPGEALANLATVTLESFYPLGSEANLTQSIVPTIGDPIVQVAQNRTFYGGPIKPEAWGSPAPPQSSLYWDSVSGLSKWFTDRLNTATGGDEVYPGDIDWSPEDVDHFLDFAVGGAGRFAARTVTTGGRLATGEETPVRDIPFLRRFLHEPDDRFDKTQYYDQRADVIRAGKLLKELADDPVRRQKHIQRRGAQLSLAPALKKVEGQLRKLRQAAKLIEDPDRLEAIKKQEQRLRSVFSAAYRKATE